jgi:hypothetical protein
MLFGGKTKDRSTRRHEKEKSSTKRVLEEVKEALHLNRRSEKKKANTKKIVSAVTRHTTKTIDKLSRLLVNKTKKLERYRARRRYRKEDSSSDSSSYSDDSSDDREIMMMMHQLHLDNKMHYLNNKQTGVDKILQELKLMDPNEIDLLPDNEYADDFGLDGNYDLDNDYYLDPEYLSPRSHYPGDVVRNGMKAFRMHFAVQRKNTTYNIFSQLTPQQRAIALNYVNKFYTYLKRRYIVEKLVEKPTPANTSVRMVVEMKVAKKVHVRPSFVAFVAANPYPSQIYKVSMTSIS